MKKILVTGATGNVGSALVKQLAKNAEVELYLGVREPEKPRQQFADIPFHLCHLDFAQRIFPDTSVDAVFLMRPPHLGDPELFRAYLSSLNPDTRVVFLSVQGADQMPYIPHAKIEKIILEMGFPHMFIRPGYFMENLLTTLCPELKENQRIYLPAGDLNFNWVAVEDIARASAAALTQDDVGSTVELSSSENYDFEEVIGCINEICGTSFTYTSPSGLRYMAYSLKKGQKLTYIFVMLLLHYLPRLGQKQSVTTTEDYARLTGQKMTSLRDFIRQHKDFFQQLAISH